MAAPEAGVSSMCLGTEVRLELSEPWEGNWEGNWGEIMRACCVSPETFVFDYE